MDKPFVKQEVHAGEYHSDNPLSKRSIEVKTPWINPLSSRSMQGYSPWINPMSKRFMENKCFNDIQILDAPVDGLAIDPDSLVDLNFFPLEWIKEGFILNICKKSFAL